MATKKELLKLRSIMTHKDGEPHNITQFMIRWGKMMAFLDELIKKG